MQQINTIVYKCNDINEVTFIMQQSSVQAQNMNNVSAVEWSKLKVVKFRQDYKPTEQQVRQYGEYIGIELPGEERLLWVAMEGLIADMPANWECAIDSRTEQEYYRNSITKQITDENPLDEYYREIVIKARNGQISSNISEHSSLSVVNEEDQFTKSRFSDSGPFLQNSNPLKEENNVSEFTIEEQNYNSRFQDRFGNARKQSKMLPRFEDIENQRQQEGKSKQTQQKLIEKLQYLKEQEELKQKLLQALKQENSIKMEKLKKMFKKYKK